MNKVKYDFLDNVTYTNIPQSTYKEVRYRDVSDSSLFNENQKNMLNDILDLYNKANKIEKLLFESSEILEYETNYSNFKIKRLEAEIENIKNEYDAIINTKETITKSIYPSSVLNTSTIKIDDKYNCLTIIPKSYEPKTYVINDLINETYMPVNIVNSIKYENLNYEIDVLDNASNNIHNIFDGNNKTYWFNKLKTNNDVNEIVMSLEFEIPDSIVTSRNVNELLIRPYPANSLDILNIEYKTLTGSYQQIPNYQDFCMSQTDFNVRWNNELEEYELIDVDSIKLNFKEIQVHKIRITVKQKYSINNNDNTKEFVLGFKCIEPRYNVYSNDYSKINFVIQFPKNKIAIFDSITPIFSNFTQVNEKKIKFDFYNLYEDGTKTKILNKAPFVCQTSQLYVECKIKADECSPNILKFEAKYKYSK